MERFAKTGFFISLISYGGFMALDALRPGFVSRTFSVHLFLLFAILFGTWWGIVVKEYWDRQWLQFVVSILLGLVFAVVTWNIGYGLGALRPLIGACALFIPLLVWFLIRN